MSGLLNSSSSTKSTDISKAIIKVLENAARQPAQVAIVTEAIHCCACYVKINSDVVEDAYEEVMKVILDTKLGLFTSDKFLSSASGAALKSLAIVAEKVVLHHPTISSDRYLIIYAYIYTYCIIKILKTIILCILITDG